LTKVLSNESYIYIGDTKNLPYGSKSPGLVKKLSASIVRYLLRFNPKALVVACNTISAVALDEVRRQAKTVPVIDVIEPTVELAIKTAKSRLIAVIATETTIASGSYQEKISSLGKNKFTVISKATPTLVPLIEESPHDHPLIKEAVSFYLDEFHHSAARTLILGCTHYPLIKKQIESYLGEDFLVIDSAGPTAISLKNLLKQRGMLAKKNHPTGVFFTSDEPGRSAKLVSEILGHQVMVKQVQL
jgi:glutamate racemase